MADYDDEFCSVIADQIAIDLTDQEKIFQVAIAYLGALLDRGVIVIASDDDIVDRVTSGDTFISPNWSEPAVRAAMADVRPHLATEDGAGQVAQLFSAFRIVP